jgi:4a-hydroxytetrahydrobiopterin dehydratase
MAILNQLKCTVCYSGDIPLTELEVSGYLNQVPQWITFSEEGAQKIRRSFQFMDFITALGFTYKVGQLAEDAGHHPTIITQWGKVTVIWWTHKIEGLHQNDFIMAAKTDLLYKNFDRK